jgi:AcrR family transcriptional regulator
MYFDGQNVLYETTCQVKLDRLGHMSGRRYEQRLRAERAEETRGRILDALYERLRAGPAGPVTVEEIAQRAGVARSTVYLVFGSHDGMFDALTERLWAGAGYDQIVQAFRHSDARETLRRGLEGGVHMYAAHHDVLRVLNAMAKLEPASIGRVIAGSEQKRAASMATLAKLLARQKLLRPGMTAPRAAHVIWVLAGFDTFDLLATGRGLRTREVVDILVDTAEHALLRPR